MSVRAFQLGELLPGYRRSRWTKPGPERKTCATPKCRVTLTAANRSGLFGRFCPSCGERLARVRLELETERRRGYVIYGLRPEDL